MNGAPAISVVMAAYNGGALVEATIASVLAQTFGDFELVVVDDCSTDDTLARLRAVPDPRVRVIENAVNGGPVVARNAAFAAARGRFIVGLDQDDLCHPDRFAVQKAWLDDHPDCVLVASDVDLIEQGVIRTEARERARAPKVMSPALIAWRLWFGNPLVWSSVMFRADAARALDMFERTDRLYAEDFDFYRRVAAQGTIARIDHPLLTYRIHPGGASQRYTARMIDSATAVLTEPYAALFGDAAGGSARLALVHFTGGAPVPDRVTLHRLNLVLARVHDHAMAAITPDARDHAAIMAEYARLWWQMADATVRSGALSLDAVAAACPPGLGLRHPRRARAAASALIGTARAIRARWRA